MAARGGRYVLTRAESGSFHFTLIAPNGEIIATSESYATKGAAQNGIDSIRGVAVDAILDDQTPHD